MFHYKGFFVCFNNIGSDWCVTWGLEYIGHYKTIAGAKRAITAKKKTGLYKL